MKTAIIYYSQHHNNTKKLIDAISAENDVVLIDVNKSIDTDLSGYDLIGVASGIYYGKFNADVMDFLKTKLPEGKDVFLLYTYAAKRDSYTKAVTQIINSRNCTIKGVYGCNGYITYGPFRLVGGVSKGHPNEEDIKGAVEFFNGLK